MKRTNIVMDEQLVSQGKELTGLKTSRELVNYALTQLIRREKQKRILALEGKVHWTGDLEQLRAVRG